MNAIVTKSYERARIEALKAEKAVRDGDELGLIHGLPIGIKDLDLLRNTDNTWVKTLKIICIDPGVIANIRTEGGVIVGKTNTPEFGAGANTRNLVFGATGRCSPKNLAGSSGGSAVALATGMVPLASGSDYGGSLKDTRKFLWCCRN